jgi:competence protein ComEA
MWERFKDFTIQFWEKCNLLILILLAVISLFLSVKYWSAGQQPQAEMVKISDGISALEVNKLSTNSNGSSTLQSKYVKADISGAVKSPGVYELRSTATVSELIAKAGGYSASADQSYISRFVNLAKTVVNEDKIYIPSRNESHLLELLAKSINASSQSTTPGDVPTGKVNLNSATEAELETLPGVGPSTAQKIIAGRPFSKIEDLMNVSGIGQITFDKLKDLISV